MTKRSGTSAYAVRCASSEKRKKLVTLEEKIIRAESLESLPSIQEIKSISRGLKMKVLFGDKIKSKREEIGQEWKIQLPKFLIGIHTIEDEINVIKLITDEEIEQNQIFFEDCAREYRELGEILINQFIEKFDVELHKEFPLKTLNPYGKTNYKKMGEMDEWKYYFHGFHCAFTNKKTEQHIEVPLTFGEEYGELDPYFFSKFIMTTTKFKPLPIEIYDNYWDGERIIEVMLELDKFEEINSNLKGRKGILVKNRTKKDVKVFNDGIGEVLTCIIHKNKQNDVNIL